MDFEFVYGAALIGVGRRREGLPHVEKVAEANQNADAHVMAGNALLELDEFDQARSHLEAAFRLNPQLPRIYTLVGIARDKTGDAANAETAFREALKIDSDDFEANLYLGAMLYQRRELSDAKPYLDRALKLNPSDPIARYHSAMLKNASKEYEVAATELEQLERSNPDWLEPHVALATLYYKLHRPNDGAREREIVDRLTSEQQARGTNPKEQ
jgi:tetratricopeptide (TPR) repeat protein